MSYQAKQFIMFLNDDKQTFQVMYINEKNDKFYHLNVLGEFQRKLIDSVEKINILTYPNIAKIWVISLTELEKEQKHITIMNPEIINMFKKYDKFHINEILSQKGGSKKYDVIMGILKQKKEELEYGANGELEEFEDDINDGYDGGPIYSSEESSNTGLSQIEKIREVVDITSKGCLESIEHLDGLFLNTSLPAELTLAQKNMITGTHTYLKLEYQKTLDRANNLKIKAEEEYQLWKKNAAIKIQKRFRGNSGRHEATDEKERLQKLDSDDFIRELEDAKKDPKMRLLGGFKNKSLKRKKRKKYTRGKKRRFRKSKKRKKRKIKSRRNK